MPISQLLFSFKGRISRQSYWLFTLAIAAVILVPAFFYFGVGTEAADTYVDAASLALLWPVLAVQAKRWHDRDKSAWWVLINFIPFIDLVRRKASKPRTQKTLLSTLHAFFKKELSEQQLAALFAALCKRGVVKVEGTKVSYALPTTEP